MGALNVFGDMSAIALTARDQAKLGKLPLVAKMASEMQGRLDVLTGGFNATLSYQLACELLTDLNTELGLYTVARAVRDVISDNQNKLGTFQPRQVLSRPYANTRDMVRVGWEIGGHRFLDPWWINVNKSFCWRCWLPREAYAACFECHAWPGEYGSVPVYTPWQGIYKQFSLRGISAEYNAREATRLIGRWVVENLEKHKTVYWEWV